MPDPYEKFLHEGEVTLESLFEPRPNVEEVTFEDCPPKYPKERRDLRCGDCGALMELRSSSKYPHPFYGCSGYPGCRGTHGAHPDGSPKGTPANKETRKARIRAHSVFDEAWKNQKIFRNRRSAYAWMRNEMHLTHSQAHIAMFSAAQCEELVKLLFQHFPELMTRTDRLIYQEDTWDEEA